MKKILEVSCNGLTNGGVQHVIMNIVSELKDDFRFDIVVFNEGPEYFDEKFLSYGGQIFRIVNKKKIFNLDIDAYIRGPRIFYNIYKILKNNGPYEAIHCHNYFESFFCLLAAKKAGVKTRIIHSHNDASYIKFSKIQTIYQNLLRRGILKNATDFIGCSKNACKYLFGSKCKAITIYNGIDLKKFQNYNNKDYNPEDKIKLLHVGNFSEQKNQMFLIDVMEELKNQKVNFELTLIGGGNNIYYNKVLDRIKEKKLSDSVKILPANSNIPLEMNSADLFLFPSNYEGLGIVLIEAQSTGLHCLVSKAIPLEADLGNIEYIAKMDVLEWSKAIYDIFKKGKKRINVDMTTYDMKKIALKYKELYENINNNK